MMSHTEIVVCMSVLFLVSTGLFLFAFDTLRLVLLKLIEPPGSKKDHHP